MTPCSFCFSFEHLDACPVKIQKIAMDFWVAGIADGKQGNVPQDKNPSYLLGHQQGLRMRRGESPLD